MSKIFIHASNVTGLGASQVVVSLIEAILKLNQDEKCNIKIGLPNHGALSTLWKGRSFCIRVKRILPNGASRLLECLFPQWYYENADNTLVLGDIPLRGIKNQVVLVHQSNLIKPCVSANSSLSLNFRVMRCLFAWNLKYVQYIIVQSDIMKQQLLASYPVLSGRVEVIPQPAPEWFRAVKKGQRKEHSCLQLFYPAAGYPHKNHVLIERLSGCEDLEGLNVSLLLTLHQDEFERYDFDENFVHNMGRLTSQECLDKYAEVDALFFPSLTESYGLPLVEAMMARLPILCADLPYARWMCGDEAIYFDPECVESAVASIRELHARLLTGWEPDWTQELSKLPASWDDVAQEFIEFLK